MDQQASGLPHTQGDGGQRTNDMPQARVMPAVQLLCEIGEDDTMSCHNGYRQSEEVRAKNSVAHIKHGHACRGSLTPTYSTWRGMYKRCNQPIMHNYDSYGGRGIKMLYPSVLDLIADIGEKPSLEYCIHRLDVDGNYEPGNCEWILISEHNRAHGVTKRYTERDRRRICGR